MGREIASCAASCSCVYVLCANCFNFRSCRARVYPVIDGRWLHHPFGQRTLHKLIEELAERQTRNVRVLPGCLEHSLTEAKVD